MKTHRVLGILWMVVCSILAIKWLLVPVIAPSFLQTVDVIGICVYLFFCLLYLAGGVASFGIFHGVQWARTFVGFIACWSFIACVAQMLASKAVSFWGGISGLFYLLSLLILFAPRHGKSPTGLDEKADRPAQ